VKKTARKRRNTMKKLNYLGAALVLLGVWLQACATTVEPVCSHKAIYQAISFQDLTGAPVRIAVGPSNKGDHAQAQAKVDGKWEWLEGNDFSVSTGYMDRVRGWKPERYVSVEEFLKYFGYEVTSHVNIAESQDRRAPSTVGDYSSSRSLYRSRF
jgi:hypothetical protein